MSKTICIQNDRGVDCLTFEASNTKGFWALKEVSVVKAEGHSKGLDTFRSGRISLSDQFGSNSYGSIVG